MLLVKCQVMFGRGLNMSFPVSSQDILNSLSTSRVRDVIIEAATTFLWTPKHKIITTKKKSVIIKLFSAYETNVHNVKVEAMKNG